ncbi:MAG TPA: hypothetical protein VND96_02380 [Candidatus Micrarchaeaceae archaeon]|nr:hypothetical protein [Candidatus Micrarchaeaceae archaeon]
MIVGEKEIAGRLEVQENTVHQWLVRRMLPPTDGSVSGNPAWHWKTIELWAWKTGRMPDLRIRILSILSQTTGALATPLTIDLIDRGWVGRGTSPTKIASVLTDLFEENYVSIHLRNEWRITDKGREVLGNRAIDKEGKPMTYQPTPEEIVRIFKQWENAAWRSPNQKVSATAPLEPPALEVAQALVPRLEQIRRDLETAEVDWHGRPIGNRDQAAMGQLWEEWRDDKLGVLNGYRDVWRSPDPFYDSRPVTK